MSDASKLLAAQDVSLAYEQYVPVVNEIKRATASSQEVAGNLSDKTSELDEEQAKVLESMLRNRDANKPSDPPHDPYMDMRIGFTWLQIPPSHIRISEVRYNDDIPGLRTSSNSLVKTGHGQIRIDLLLDFVGEDGINKELREVIAQFRSTPFIPLESQYVYNAIMAQAANVPAKTIDDLNLKVMRAYDEYVKIQRQMVDILVANPAFMRLSLLKTSTTEAAIRERLLNMLPDELLTQLSDTVGSAGLKNTAMGPARSVGMGELLKDSLGNPTIYSVSGLTELGRTANNILITIRDTHAELVRLGIPTASRRPVVPVVLHTLSIETVPGEIDTLRVRLACLYFAFGPYVQEFAYKTALGTPTLDISQCPWFSYYVRRRYLAGDTSADLDQPSDMGMGYLGKFRFAAGQSFTFQYPTPRFVPAESDDAKFDLTLTVPAEAVGPNSMYSSSGAGIRTKKVKPEPETLEILTGDPNLIPVQTSIVIQNRVAIQPIQGCLYGTAQHLGAINAKISVAFHAVGDDKYAHDRAVARIHRMKLLTDQVALIGGPKARRSSKIRVTNDLLALAGVRAVQIDGVTTRNNPGEIYSSTVMLDLTEYTVNQDKREQLRMARPDLRDNLSAISLDYAIDIADRYLRDDQSTERGQFANSPAGPYCFQALYRNGGILTKGVMTQVFANRPEIVGAILENLKKEFAKTKQEEEEKRKKEEQADLSGISSIGKFYGYNSGLGTDNFGRAASNPPSSFLKEYTSSLTKAAEVEKRPTSNDFFAELSRLAGEALKFWSASKRPTKIAGKVPAAPLWQIDSKKYMEFDRNPNKYLKEIVTTIRGPGFPDELAGLDALMDYARDNFKEVQDAMLSKMKDIRAISNYPDLALPTFADAFFGSSEMLGATPATSLSVQAMRIFTTKYMGAKTKEVMRRFMPTWSDLGRQAPLDQDKYDIAKQPTDPVDPDFFYYHNRVSQYFDSQAEELSSEVDALYNPPSTEMNPDQSTRTKGDINRADAKRIQNQRAMRPERASAIMEGDRSDLVSNLDLVPNPDGSYGKMRNVQGMWKSTPVDEGFGNTPMHSYMPANPKLRKAFGELQHDSPANMRSLFREVLDTTKDDVGRLSRAFPTFRLYFIEEDNEQFGYWDDFYAYNAVIDFQLSEHKFEPSLLQIRLINVTGNLDQARTSYEDQDRLQEDASWIQADGSYKDPRPPLGSAGLEKGTGERKQLSAFFLQTGTPIMLKVGYGSSDEDLEIKFTGQIVEIDPGDVITIIAQSYKNELTVPLNTFISSSAEPYRVVQWIMENSPTMHFGKWSPYEAGILNGQNVAGEDYNRDSPERVGWDGYRAGSADGKTSEARKQAEGVYGGVGEAIGGAAGAVVGTVNIFGGPITGYLAGKYVGGLIGSALGGAAATVAELTSDRKMSNIYLPRQSFWRNWFSSGSEYLIPDSTGLEVLHELTRHLPGYVFDVRPYDHQATLFFGKPEQRYWYTSLKQNEERLWLDYQRNPSKPNENLIIDVVLNFEGSVQGSVFKENFRARHTAGKEIVKSLSSAAGSIPGRLLGTLTFGLMGKDYKEEGKRVGRELLSGYTESPDITTDIKYIEKNLGDTNLKVILAYFFNRYTSTYASGDKSAEAWITLAKRVGDPLGGILHPIESATSILQAGLSVTQMLGNSSEADKVVDSEGGQTVQRQDGRIQYVKDINKVQKFTASATRDSLLPGSILVSLTDWRDKVEKMGLKNDGTNEYNRSLRSMMEKSTDLRALNAMHDGNAGVTDAHGNQIPRDAYDKMVESILDVMPDWKLFMSMLKMWLEQQILIGDTKLLKEAYNEGRKAEKYEHNPRTKRFRDHHMADALQHIIKNGIIATKEQMANTVVVQYSNNIGNYTEGGGRYFVAYDKHWSTFELMVNENIQPNEKKVRLITELNIDQSIGAELAAYSNLAEALRPMYRGELILRGNERIKPHDIIWINDPYENTFGPIEAERVITHFGPDTGYITTVVPHAICIPQSRSSWIDCMVCGQLNALKSLGWIGGATLLGGVLGTAASPILGGAAGGAGGFAMGGPAGGAVGIGTGSAVGLILAPVGAIGGAGIGLIGSYMWQSWKLNEESGAGLWGNLTGRGRYGSMRAPVDIIPLVRNGSPWTAGLRGWSDADWTLRIFKQWSNITRGAGLTSEIATKAWEDL